MPAQKPNPEQDPMALPPTFSPDSLDSLTELTTILTRLRTAIQSTSGPSGIPGSTPLPTGATPNPSATSPAPPGGGLSLKDVPTATDHIKHKLQKARVQVRALPDMERTMAEQEGEIAELERRIRTQREVLERLRKGGAEFTSLEAVRGEKDS